MSFKPNLSDVALCNRALSLLSQEPISSVVDMTPIGRPARACNRWYKPTVSRLLELHHFSLARIRVALTQLDNDRSSEWQFKFQLPTDVAFPVSLGTLGAISDVQYYQGLAGLLATRYGKPVFLKTQDAIYSQYEGDLDYVSYEITEADFNATFADIVELMLAATMCYDLTKNRARAEDLRQQATSAINIAITQDMNVGNPTYGDGLSEREIVRGSGYSHPWDWWPGLR